MLMCLCFVDQHGLPSGHPAPVGLVQRGRGVPCSAALFECRGGCLGCSQLLCRALRGLVAVHMPMHIHTSVCAALVQSYTCRPEKGHITHALRANPSVELGALFGLPMMGDTHGGDIDLLANCLRDTLSGDKLAAIKEPTCMVNHL